MPIWEFIKLFYFWFIIFNYFPISHLNIKLHVTLEWMQYYQNTTRSRINTVLYFSQFFQNRRIFHSTFSDSSYQKINRSLLKFKIYKRENISLNFDSNFYLHSNDKKNYLKKWSNFYINSNYKNLNLFLGYQFFEGRKNNSDFLSL